MKTDTCKKMVQNSLPQYIKYYHHRVLTLEIELRQMGRDRLASKNMYKKRVLKLKKIKSKLAQFETYICQKNSILEKKNILLNVPERNHRSPEESELCINFLSECNTFAKKLKNDSSQVVTFIKKSVHGNSFNFITNFGLSRLKKKLVNLEGDIQAFKHEQQGWKKYVDSILNHMHILKTNKLTLSTVQTFKSRFYELEKMNSQILKLRHECEKSKDEIELMENWLSMQKWKLSQFYPLK